MGGLLPDAGDSAQRCGVLKNLPYLCLGFEFEMNVVKSWFSKRSRLLGGFFFDKNQEVKKVCKIF
jgi:hypothetical protein